METNIHKEKLLAEKNKLEGELNTVGMQNPENPLDWNAKNINSDTDIADEGEVAIADESMATNMALSDDLELQLKNVNESLHKIEDGTFGKCEVCGNEIEEERLMANPSSKTCKEHMNG
jgi:RNA polymerase-binding transcription factor DksA